jgi:hypothetical protein
MRRLAVFLVLAAGCAGGRPAPRREPAVAADRFGAVHRLIDLYDTARYAQSAEARAALGRELGFAVGTGPAATEKVILALLLRVDGVLAADRLHVGAQAARTLLEFDGTPPAVRREVLQRMREVKAIARGSGPMAPNARLRLAGYCWRALQDATRAPWRQRPFAMCHCLYALYDSDPDPYFDRDPDRRPPLPAWKDLVQGATRLLFEADHYPAGAGELIVPKVAWGSLDGARKRLGAMLLNLGATADQEMPVEPVSEVMVAADAPLYDWAPVAESGMKVDALRERIQGDGRGQVALRLAPGGKRDVVELAETARKAGAGEIQLLAARRQKIDAPPGDYWHGKPAEVTRAAVVPISLAPLGALATGPRSPYAIDFAAGLRLALVVGASRWRLVGEGGELASIRSNDKPDPAALLVEALVRVRSAFPDQQALAMIIEPGAPNAQVIAAAAAAARRNGAPFFRLGLAAGAPAVKGSSLAKRVALRAGASVAIVPDTLAARKPAVLACYQDALEKAPKLAGAVRLEPKNGAAAVVGAADRRLAACATAALGKFFLESGAASAEVTFRVSGSR